MVRNMAHRTGVQVVGPDDLKNDSGSKVKLTGQWQPLPQIRSSRTAQPPGNSQRPEKTAGNASLPGHRR